MIFKETLLVPSDRSGVWSVGVIHVFAKQARFIALSNFGKVSIKKTSSNSRVLRKKKKKIIYTRAGIVKSRRCGAALLATRSCLLLKKRLTPVGRRVGGYIDHSVRRRKAESSFIQIL
jgi:ribosomal protein L14